MASRLPPAATRERLRALAEEIEHVEGLRRPVDDRPTSTGFAALDRLLPRGGLARGTLVEYLAEQPACGAASLALCAACAAGAEGGALVVVDRSRRFYPPAAAAWGVELSRLIVVQPANAVDERWTLDQVLRSPVVAAVLAWPASEDGKDFRRWQLAVEAGGSLGLFVRPALARDEPSWAEVRWGVSPLAAGADETSPFRRWRVELLKCRGVAAGATAEVAIDDATHSLPVALRPRAAEPRRERA